MAEERLTVAQKLNLLPRTYHEAESLELLDEISDDAEYKAFINGKQPSQRAEMLDLVFKDGRHESFSYSHLYRSRFSPHDGIYLQFSEHVVVIKGVQLRLGYRRILGRKVIQVTEADSPTVRLADAGEAVVTSIKVEIYQPEPVDG